MSDNFWMMADTGPCGPCSEVFYDHGPEVAGGPPGSPDAEGDRYIEIWNHVFMQFDMQPDGSVKNLPAPCVDTGMGLERLAAVMQHVHSNYEIDLFQELIKAAARETYTKDLDNPSLKVIADHIRACAFLVSDGVIPGSEGRGYVQRRIIRRAIRHGYKLGQKTPFFHKLVPDLAKLMGAAYPSLAAKAAQISEVLKVEEVRFFETLENGMEILDASIDEMNNSGAKPASVVLPGDVAFRLHDTYGFPLDLTQDVCRERGVTVDEAGFNAAMDKQKAQARAAGKFKMDRVLEYLGAVNQFVGYERLEQQAKVVALYFEGAPVKELKSGQEGIVVLDDTPFYAESGGQVGDEGAIVASGVRFDVSDTLKVKADVHGMHGTLAQGTLRVGDVVKAQVDTERRTATMRNHSVTHIMHKALREVLGDHVQQKGSLVDAEKTRFDFSHNRPMTDDEIREVEARVNAEILQNLPTRARVLPIEEAKKTGAMMLFGEKYGDEVRVLDIGTSRELCGGTHVARTGDIGLFKVLAESGVAAGVRRLEATTGATALVMLNTQQQELREIAHKLNVPPMGGMVALAVTKLLDDKKLAEKELARLKSKVASSQGDDLVSQADDVGGVKVLAAALEGADVKTLRETLDKLKDMLKSAAIVLGTSEGGKVTLIAGVTADLTSKLKAGDLVNFVAQQVGGKGGGRPDMAQAGGTDPSKLPEALASVRGWVAQRQH
jgi:alanyl-tRNA synthetase